MPRHGATPGLREEEGWGGGARRHRRGRDDRRRAEQPGRGVLRRGRRPRRADRSRAGAREAPALDHAPQLGLLEGGAAGGDVHARRAAGGRAAALSTRGSREHAAVSRERAAQENVPTVNRALR